MGRAPTRAPPTGTRSHSPTQMPRAAGPGTSAARAMAKANRPAATAMVRLLAA